MVVAVAATVTVVAGGGGESGGEDGPEFCPDSPEVASASPAGFFGLDSQTPDSAGDYRTMRCGGAHSVRIYAPWAAINPAPGTYLWRELDRAVLGAADADLDPLLFVYLTPGWTLSPAELATANSPRRIGATLPVGTSAEIEAWRGFLRRLADRYGPDGTLWQSAGASGHERRPVRLWQIWNEANLGRFSSPRPDPIAFARLQSLGYEAIHDADPGATVLTGGLSAITVGQVVEYGRFLERMLRTAAGRGSFDALAIHPYASSSTDVVQVLNRTRRILDRHGLDSTPIWVTEVGWSSFPPCLTRPIRPGGGVEAVPSCEPSSKPLFKGRRGQARVLAQTMRILLEGRARWRLTRAYVFSWRDLPPSLWSSPCAFCLKAGLVSWRSRPDGTPVPKPSWRIFERLAR
jgi:polysaccharide biosynthesis protein PslG